MYQKPHIEKFGSFRELTRVGAIGSSDGGTFRGASSVGCGGAQGNGQGNCPDPYPTSS